MSELKIIGKAGYLVLPVSDFVGNHQLCFMKDGKVFEDITLRLDYRNPTAYSYYPIGEYMGQEITLSVSPDMELRDIQTDKPEHDGTGEALRHHRFLWLRKDHAAVADGGPGSAHGR